MVISFLSGNAIFLPVAFFVVVMVVGSGALVVDVDVLSSLLVVSVLTTVLGMLAVVLK